MSGLSIGTILLIFFFFVYFRTILSCFLECLIFVVVVIEKKKQMEILNNIIANPEIRYSSSPGTFILLLALVDVTFTPFGK